jgi:hypothetical protein
MGRANQQRSFCKGLKLKLKRIDLIAAPPQPEQQPDPEPDSEQQQQQPQQEQQPQQPQQPQPPQPECGDGQEVPRPEFCLRPLIKASLICNRPLKNRD